jgi:hypothetical protein
VTLSLHSRITLDSHARYRRFDDEGLIVQQTTAEAIVVNETAARLLELSDGQRTLADCAHILEVEFEAETAVIEHDVLLFAEELVTAGVASVR